MTGPRVAVERAEKIAAGYGHNSVLLGPLALDLLDARAEVERLRELLRDVEWVQPMYNGSPSCSCCGNQQHWGHAEGCELTAAIKERAP